MRSKYFVAIKKNDSSVLDTLDTYLPLLPPRGEFYADPMLFKKDGINYLFFEVYDYKKGVISYVALDEEGNCSKEQLALELPTHLSFPYVFEDDGEIYMTPETYAYREASLFKATRFPDQWEKVRVLVDGEDFADSMIFKHNGLYWLFTSVNGDDLRIYYALELTGRFRPHPINDRKLKGRNAGGVYWDHGRLIRPVMDCSKGYGREMVLKEIVLLTSQEFEERDLHRIEPIWAPGLNGTHTYNQNEDFVIYDGRRTISVEEDALYSRSP